MAKLFTHDDKVRLLEEKHNPDYLESFSAKAIGKDWPSFKQIKKEVYQKHPEKYGGSPDKLLNSKLNKINKRHAAQKRKRPKYSR